MGLRTWFRLVLDPGSKNASQSMYPNLTVGGSSIQNPKSKIELDPKSKMLLATNHEPLATSHSDAAYFFNVSIRSRRLTTSVMRMP